MILLRDIKRILFTKEALIHLVIWWLFFSMLNVGWTSNWFHRTEASESVSPLSATYFFLFFYANAFWFLPRYFKPKTWYLYLLVVAAASIIPELLRAFIVVASSSENFTEAIYSEFFSRDSLLQGFPNPFWFGFLFSCAYRFTKDWLQNSRKIERLEKEKLAIELSALKSQINPHFLFNNLNALDDLIDRDKGVAKDYLHKLSNILRYSIASLEKDVVNLNEEWRAIDDYIFLIEERFGGAYQFKKSLEMETTDVYLVPPASLQTLIENVVKHNQGSVEEPLLTSIQAAENGITISHQKRPMTMSTNGLGTGLNNIKSRYKLLSNEEITIVDDETFSVTLPLIKQVK